MATGFLYDPRFLDHQTGAGHPECPERLTATLHHLKTQAWFSQLQLILPREAEPESLFSIHTPRYVKHAQENCEAGMRYLDTPDVGISEASFETALLAAGGALALADAVMMGTLTNGFALLRPPGHHAEADMAMGFCLFNNIAILARYLQKQHGLDKILILDWDVHHGNGTQHTFEEDPSVLYVSLHQYPFYPGTGAAAETGIGRGRDATLNCPMPAGAGNREYEKAFIQKILPKVTSFRPEIILISAGFDAHAKDPLARINLSTAFFGWMSSRLMEAAHQFSGGRLISLLEGGYNLGVLPACIEAHLKVLVGIKIDGAEK